MQQNAAKRSKCSKTQQKAAEKAGKAANAAKRSRKSSKAAPKVVAKKVPAAKSDETSPKKQ